MDNFPLILMNGLNVTEPAVFTSTTNTYHLPILFNETEGHSVRHSVPRDTWCAVRDAWFQLLPNPIGS